MSRLSGDAVDDIAQKLMTERVAAHWTSEPVVKLEPLPPLSEEEQLRLRRKREAWLARVRELDNPKETP
jgi:hypothetical protein